MKNFSRPTIDQILEYESGASKWMRYVSWPWLQNLAGSYLAWKVRRKYNRYIRFKMAVIEVENRLMKKEIAMNTNILSQIKKESLCKK